MPDLYAFYCIVKERDLARVKGECALAEAQLRGYGLATKADQVRLAYAALEGDLAAMAVDLAIEGTELLKAQERETRVRPDTAGGGGPRLEDYLRCEVLPPLGEIGIGSIGVANETLLDQNVEWWWTNEVGYSGHIGRVLYGVFQPGEAVPNAGEFRVHPLFEPRGSEGGSGEITHPIPAREFILKAVHEIETRWLAAFEFVRRSFEAEVAAAQIP